MKTKPFIFLSFICALVSTNAMAQPSLTLPQASQLAEVKQRIGLTDVTIVYHSPLVGGRKIWGELVPYGQVWRAGANENTTISFTDDVKIEGSPLPAGTYGLHMIPNADEWTIIFSKDHTSWGSFFYDQKEDALRVHVKPGMHDFQNWLEYSFTDRSTTSSKITLSWEKTAVSFTVDVDVNAVTLKHIREQLKNLPAFGWHGWEAAAHYCIENKIDYDEAMKWINTSIQIEENYTNVAAKAQLLALMGKAKEAGEARKKVMTLLEPAGENQVNAFGYELMGEHDIQTALKVFKLNAKNHPESWNVYDSMAEAFNTSGDHKQSLSNYKIALSKAPADQHARIRKIIASLEKG